MRHGKKFNHLGRKTAHRKSMFANMACSLIEHKRINTTVAKAKALKQFVEPIITKSKEDTTHNRRLAFAKLRQKEAVTELFRDVAAKVGNRPGGYTRIIKLGNRLGDNADMAMIELVDYNELYKAGKTDAKKTTRRSRRGGKSTEDETTIEGKEGKSAVPAVEKPEAKKADEAKPADEVKKTEAKAEEAEKPKDVPSKKKDEDQNEKDA